MQNDAGLEEDKERNGDWTERPVWKGKPFNERLPFRLGLDAANSKLASGHFFFLAM